MGWWLSSNQLRIESDGVATNWESNAQKKKAAMQAEHNSLEDWKKSNVKQYYESNFNYLDEVAANPVPYLEISWCTRFNAFVPKIDSKQLKCASKEEIQKMISDVDDGGVELAHSSMLIF